MKVTYSKSDLFVPVCWPEVQALMEHPGFCDNCHLIDDHSGYEQYGDSAYMCNVEWLESLD